MLEVSGAGFFVAPEDAVAVVPAAVTVVWVCVERCAVEVEEKEDDAIEEGERGEAGE